MMSMYSTKMSLGRWSGTGVKLIRLLTPARTSTVGHLLGGASGHREHGYLEAQVAHQRLHVRGVEAAYAVEEAVGEDRGPRRRPRRWPPRRSCPRSVRGPRARGCRPRRARPPGSRCRRGSCRCWRCRRPRRSPCWGCLSSRSPGRGRGAPVRRSPRRAGRADASRCSRRLRHGAKTAVAGSGSSARLSSSTPCRFRLPQETLSLRSLQNKRCEICHDSLAQEAPCQLQMSLDKMDKRSPLSLSSRALTWPGEGGSGLVR